MEDVSPTLFVKLGFGCTNPCKQAVEVIRPARVKVLVASVMQPKAV